MTTLDIGPTPSLEGTMYVDVAIAANVRFFDEVTTPGGPSLSLSDIEDADYIYESPTVVTAKEIIVGASAIRSYFDK